MMMPSMYTKLSPKALFFAGKKKNHEDNNNNHNKPHQNPKSITITININTERGKAARRF